MSESAIGRQAASHPVAILGVAFDSVTLDSALQRIEEMIASRQPHYLVTANVDFLVQARADIELRRILLEAHLVLCDGTPVLWASRLFGNPLPERVAGADLVPRFIGLAAEKGYRIFFLGATPESCEAAVTRLRATHPKLQIAGQYSPPFRKLLEMDHEEIRCRVKEANPDVLLVSFGCPKQEKWIAMHYRDLGVPVAAGVGATIDFLAGTVRRAPVWMQRTGTEWVFRLLQEPRRLMGRYSRDLWVFAWAVLAQCWGVRRTSRRPFSPAPTNAEPQAPVSSGPLIIRLPEWFDLAALSSAILPEQLPAGSDCLVDAREVKFIDSSAVGRLIRWHKNASAAGKRILLLGPSLAVRKVLKVMRLDTFITSAPDLESALQMLNRGPSRVPLVSAEVAGGVLIVRWNGEVTAANAPEVWEGTEPFLQTLPAPEQCVLDFGKVSFIDSSGLGLMIRFRKRANKDGFALSFRDLQPAVTNVVRLAQLEKFLFAPVPERTSAPALVPVRVAKA